MTERIGFIGLGIMGKPMVRNLAKAGFSLVLHNRSADDVEELVAEGGPYEVATSPREVAERAKTAGVQAVVFDRGGNRYHGRVAALAEGAREGGLDF